MGIKNKIANIISCIRIVCGVGLAFCVPFSQWFYLIYIIGGISDVLDGFVARQLKTESKLGARLDTIADVVFVSVVIVKVLTAVNVPLWIIIWIILIAVIKCINYVSGIVISRKLVAEHTAMNKICGILLFAIPFCIRLLPWQAVSVLVIATCALATVAAIQEGHYIRIGKECD